MASGITRTRSVTVGNGCIVVYGVPWETCHKPEWHGYEGHCYGEERPVWYYGFREELDLASVAALGIDLTRWPARADVLARIADAASRDAVRDRWASRSPREIAYWYTGSAEMADRLADDPALVTLVQAAVNA